MLGPLRPLALAAGLLTVLAAPALAAPTWLPTTTLSTAATTPGGSDPSVGSDTAGESFAAWTQYDGAHNRTVLASHAPGQPWSAGANVSTAGQDASDAQLSVSSTGYAALVWLQSNGTGSAVQVARRAPGGAFGAAQTLSTAGVDETDLDVAVDATGDVVVIWQDNNPYAIHARRYTATTGQWGPIADLQPAVAGQLTFSPTVVISATGTATAAWVYGASGQPFQEQSSSSGLNGAWSTAAPVSSVPMGWSGGPPQLAIDAAGNVTLAWDEYTTTGAPAMYVNGIVREATRPSVDGVWSAPVELSDPLLQATSPVVAATSGGDVTVAWTELGSDDVKVVTRPFGGSFPAPGAATAIVTNNKTISAGLIQSPWTSLRMSAGTSGTLVTFVRQDDAMNLRTEAVFRPTGGPWPSPATTPPTMLSPAGSDTSEPFGQPDSAIDGLGNAVVVWPQGTVVQSASYDVSPPAFTNVSVPTTGTTGQPVSLTATTLDTWSALAAGQPGWSFGDGGTGAGATLTHVYTAPGTYTVTVGASDAVGNAAVPATRQIVITSPAIPPTVISQVKVTAVWKSNKLVGTVLLSGTVGVSTNLTATVKQHGSAKTSLSARFNVTVGGWSHILTLPSGLVPGVYDVTVAGNGAPMAKSSFTLAAPAAGIVKRSYASATRTGAAHTALGKTHQLWAHFTFGTLPAKSKRITVQWIRPSGKRNAIIKKSRTTTITSQIVGVKGRPIAPGRWRCVIRVGGVTLVTLNVRLV